MCRLATTVLPTTARSPGLARGWTGTRLASWGVEDDDVSVLLASELVTNAVTHARTPATLTLAVATGMIEIAVADLSPGRLLVPAQRSIGRPGSAGPLLDSGRGLIIVEALSEDWGLTRNGTGKQVWSRRPVPADWPFAGTCPCAHESAAAQPLPSGHPVVAIPGPWDAGPDDRHPL